MFNPDSVDATPTYYDYCANCHSEQRMTWLNSKLTECMECHHAEDDWYARVITPTLELPR